jgi:hypothetical protein
MATKRQTKKTGGRKRKAARSSTGARQRRPAGQGARTATRQRRPAQPGARSGARQARRDEAALELERRETARGPRLVTGDPDEMSAAAEREAAWTRDAEGVPTFARKGNGQAMEGGPDGGPAVPTGREEAGWDAGEGATFRARAAREADAGAELARWRAEVEAARRAEAGRDLPGFGEIAVEIAIGALRLARTLLTAPLRIGLAFLRPI